MEASNRRAITHRRTSKVCARCKKRKTKCDSQYPACTPCMKAGLDCFNSLAETELPRSLVRSLEDQVAQLESQMEVFRQSPNNLPHLFSSKIAKATISVGLASSRSFFNSRISPDLFLHPSCPPLAVARAKSQSQLASAQSQRPTSSPTNLKTVPLAAIQHMLQNYTSIHLPQYPCITEPWLRDIFKQILEEQSGDTDLVMEQGIPTESGLGHFEYFVAFIVLAISSLTLTWRAESQAMAASDSFYVSALNHLRLLLEIDQIRELQVSLLLAHYAHMNPENADNWICISNAVRVVLNLGLHLQPSKVLSEDQAELRCRLFRVAYGMERSLCGNLRLPLSFPEESITVKFDHSSIDGSFLNDVARKESSANHIYLYRALETEVHRVLYLQEAIPQMRGRSLSQWTRDITSNLQLWYEKAQNFAIYQMLEFRDVQYSHLLMKIHRPAPKIRVRTSADQLICLRACRILVGDYQKQMRHRRLFYPWHGVHILFEAAVVMLDACWSSRDLAFMLQEAVSTLSATLPDCLAILDKIGQRWQEATICAEHLRPIVAEVSRRICYELGDDVVLRDQEKEEHITEKLRQLLFPDGPLASNNRAMNKTAEISDKIGMNDPGSISISHQIESFQWDKEWDLADFLYGLPGGSSDTF
ncbi:hypothetical protein BP6252_03732 [Coleophoma cylindrospora]|uniref:Zn(2)-C6 fungal-type domain-containing protein n=1 Tax=Coleophoma cylindrospora TaxID=1849047 RepID=A0A3D8S8Q8_9HELO|nr:hypothetical protein BP6252_03732 [Coleophoma cylindrospora]